MKRDQVTCACSAYEFPHRLGKNSGKCDGSEWAESYLTFEGTYCNMCPAMLDIASCNVSMGQEDITYCLGWQVHMLRQPNVRHPMREESLNLVDDRFNYEYEETVDQELDTEYIKKYCPF